jgi:dihydropyrimidinase
MADFDLVIAGGTLVTDTDESQQDLGIADGRIAALGQGLRGRETIDARGHLVMPGGVDSHCHIEEMTPFGMMCADDFESATISAAFGGTTTVIPFAAQHRGMSVSTVIADYEQRAARGSVIDYALHLIVTDPGHPDFVADIDAAVERGINSFKVYMTYDALKLDDERLLDMLCLAESRKALLMVHAENHEVIRWLTRRLLAAGHTAPKFHMASHHPLAEAEATNRIISLSRLLDVPILIVHVSEREATRTIRAAQSLGARIHAETCPQYLFLTGDAADLPGLEGAKFCCSPPPRDKASQDAIWDGLRDGTFAVVSSDHAPYRFDETGKIPLGEATDFSRIANGLPGLQARLPLLFSGGVGEGRITRQQFVALTSTNHAKLYGLYPRKGSLEPGADADLAIWDPDLERTLTASIMKDRTGYTPYEGIRVRGWPTTVISRGRVVVDGDSLRVKPGSGQRVACGVPMPMRSLAPNAGPAGWLRRLID